MFKGKEMFSRQLSPVVSHRMLDLSFPTSDKPTSPVLEA